MSKLASLPARTVLDRDRRALVNWVVDHIEAGRLPATARGLDDRIRREVATIAAMPNRLTVSVGLPGGPVAFEIVEARIVYCLTVAARVATEPDESGFDYELRRQMDMDGASIPAHRGGPVSCPMFLKEPAGRGARGGRGGKAATPGQVGGAAQGRKARRGEMTVLTGTAA